MDIRFILKYSDKEDLIDPFGTVVITDVRATLTEPDTFLYGWLDSLIEGVSHLRVGESSRGFVGEPNKLVFEATDSGARIKYGDTVLCVESLEEVDRAVKTAAKELLNTLYEIGQPAKGEFLDRIVAFVEEGL